MEKKICPICNRELELTTENFFINPINKILHREECKECILKIKEKKCRICGEVLPIENFHKKKISPDGHSNDCKNCMKEISKHHRDKPENKDKNANYRKKYYEENREHCLKNKKEYHIKNRG